MENEDYNSENDEEEDPKDPATMMMNLGITTGDVFEDESNSNAARNASVNVVSQQVLFYVACCLRGHMNKLIPAAPVILVYGGGYIGQRVIDALTKAKCAEMLYVYTRGDLKAKYWRTKGLKSSPSMNRLLKGKKVDIVILLAGMSSFSNMTKLLLPHITRSTCVINAAFGLERRRFFALLRTPAVFRTYLEPQSLLNILEDNTELADSLKAGQLGIMAGLGADVPGIGVGGTSNMDKQLLALRQEQEEKCGGGEEGELDEGGEKKEEDDESTVGRGEGDLNDVSMLLDESLAESLEQEASLRQHTVLDSILTFRVELQPLLADTKEGTIAYAAELIAQRTRDMRDIIFVLENYYAMLGLRHRVARTQALIAVLGFDPQEMGALLASQSGDNISTSVPGSGVNNNPEGGEDSKDPHSSVLTEMLKTVKVESHGVLVAALEATEEEVSSDFRRQFSKYIRLIDIPDPNALGDSDTRGGANKRKNRKINPALHGKPEAIQTVGDGEIRDDGYNDDDAEEKEHAGEHGVPIHTDARIKKIMAYDAKLRGPLKAKIGGLLDEFTASMQGSAGWDGDAEDHSVGGDSISTLGDGSLHVEPVQGTSSSMEAHPAPAPAPAPLSVPKMMANPLVASDEDAKLLNLLQEEARKSDAAQTERERRAFLGE